MGGSNTKTYADKKNSSKKTIRELLALGLQPEEAEHIFKLLGEERTVSTYVVRVSIDFTLSAEQSTVFPYSQNAFEFTV